MTYKKDESKAVSLQVTEGLAVIILPNSNHEFLMPTKEVALGYGISESRIRHHAGEHSNELIEGKHFIRGVRIPHVAGNGTSLGTMWTKRGVVRLGFFIKSERAAMFRDWAEDLIIGYTDKEQRQLNDLLERAQFVAGSANKLAKMIGVSSPTLSMIKHPERWSAFSVEMKTKIINRCDALINGNLKVKEADNTKLVDLLADVCLIDDKALRIRIANKLTGRAQ